MLFRSGGEVRMHLSGKPPRRGQGGIKGCRPSFSYSTPKVIKRLLVDKPRVVPPSFREMTQMECWL